MCWQVSLGVVAAVVFSVIESGYALECWMCNSDLDITCRDPFDIPRIQENTRNALQVVNENHPEQPVINYPHINRCDETKYTYYLKNVCQKKIVKNFKGEIKFKRQCRLVSHDLAPGACPEDKDDGETLFCGTCETDFCNSANAKETNIFSAVALSALLMLLLRN